MCDNHWRKDIERLENNDIKSYECNPWKSEIERLINDETIKEDKNE